MPGRRRPAREVNRAECGLTSASRPTSKGAPPGCLGQKQSLAAVVRIAWTSISARLASTIDLLGILDSATPDEICPGAVVRSARWWAWDLPGVATDGHILQVLRDGNERASDIAVATWPRCARPCTPVTRLPLPHRRSRG